MESVQQNLPSFIYMKKKNKLNQFFEKKKCCADLKKKSLDLIIDVIFDHASEGKYEEIF